MSTDNPRYEIIDEFHVWDKPLVERLRTRQTNTSRKRLGRMCAEAADEIEAKDAEIERLRNALHLIAEGEYDYGSHIAERTLGGLS